MLKRIRDLLTRKPRSAAGEAVPATTTESALDDPAQPVIHHGPKVVHEPIDEADLDPDAVKIIQRLTRFDHGAYLVGGCVRDLLLEREPKDFDIGTSATPRQIKRLFRNSRIIGRRFRLAHIYFQNGKIIEVATFRAQEDGAGSDGDEGEGEDLLIRDDNQFGTMEEDALRRDFTINALFYDMNKGTVLDHADGLNDLRRKTIRTIGDPTIRFKQDPIRILRAIKFAARLDFDIEPATERALRATCDEIPKAAAPRILEELNRFCRGGASRRSVELMKELGVFEVVLPELALVYEDPETWSTLFAFLDAFDARTAKGDEVQTGEILAAFLLPALMSDFGWSADGSVVKPDGLDVRERVDRMLRPLAARLRVSRKDQEHCRQVLQSLQRMVPSKRLHRNTKRALSRRATLGDSVALLSTVAQRYGGEFETAAEYWSEVLRSRPKPGPESDDDARGRTGSRGRGSGRRGRRGGRGRRRSRGSRESDTESERPVDDGSRESDTGADRPRKEASPAAETKSERPKEGGSWKKTRRSKQGGSKNGPAEKLPPVWDDDYFFAALPTAPESGTDADDAGNRYRLAETDRSDREDPSDSESDSESGSETEPSSRSRRRRRPRRRRRTKTTGAASGSEGNDDGD
jgi:poly(A) polymerase